MFECGYYIICYQLLQNTEMKGVHHESALKFAAEHLAKHDIILYEFDITNLKGR
jgi:hypothetical protein